MGVTPLSNIIMKNIYIKSAYMYVLSHTPSILHIAILHDQYTVNPVLLAAATITVVCNRNENENAKVGVQF